MQPEHGLSANERALLRGAIHAWQPSASMQGWFPVSIGSGPDGALLHWRYLGQQALTDSFFVDSLMAQEPQQRKICRTPFSALDQLTEVLQPTAFIFHVSRCGSTLLCQLLSTLPTCTVVSEPPVIDALLRFQFEQQQTTPERVQGLRKMILALGQKRSNLTQHFFLKFDSWHIHHLPLLRLAFPDTPCLFLYREPQAVLASHRRQRGPQMVPHMLHPEVLPVSPDAFKEGDLDTYAAHVLQGFFQTALVSADQLHLLNYHQLPDVVWTEILEAYGIRHTPEQYAALQQRPAFHSKNGSLSFRGDPATPESLRQRTLSLLPSLQSSYQQLELIRQG